MVLVHCNAGVSRAAAIVIGFLMNSERLNFASAYSLVKNARPAVCPNPGFMEQLHKYEEQNTKANGSIDDHDWSKGQSETICSDYTVPDAGCTLISRFAVPFHRCILKSLFLFIYFFSPRCSLFCPHFSASSLKAIWYYTDLRDDLTQEQAFPSARIKDNFSLQ